MQATATELILADQERGAITDDEALLDRLYAMFGDDRLPAAYRTAPAGEDNAALAIAAQALAAGDLSQTATDAIAPFLARPDDPTSLLHGAAGSALLGVRNEPALYAAEDQPVCGPYDWAYMSSATQPVKVWTRCDNPRLQIVLPNLLGAAETLYGDEIKLMGPAIIDNGAPAGVAGYRAGGDTKIDIYLSDGCLALNRGNCTGPSIPWAGYASPAEPFVQQPAGKSSGYIVIKTQYGEDLEALWSITAHEIFHVLQFAHLLGGYTDNGRSHWFVEASAKWAEEHFVADGREHWVYPWLGTFQNSQLGLADVNANNEYASFVWPYFMDQKAGADSVAAAWRAMEGKNGWDEVNQALNGVFSFADNFRDFAVQAFNVELHGNPTAPNLQKPDEDMPQWGPGAAKQPPGERLEALDENHLLAYSVSVPPLAMRYDAYGIAGEVAKIVVDFSGVEPQDKLDVVGLLQHRDGNWERRPMTNAETTFCLNRPEDDLTAFFLVIADHGWQPADALTGSYTISPTEVPCEKTTFSIDLSSSFPTVRDKGHYEGSGEIECWHDVDGTWTVATQFKPPQAGKIDGFEFAPDLLTVFVEDPEVEGTANPWFISSQEAFQLTDAYGQITITPSGDAQAMTLTASGSSKIVSISVKVSCGIVHEPDEEPLP
jgi:hypothetical protein